MTTTEINYSDNHWIGFHGKIDTGNHFFLPWSHEDHGADSGFNVETNPMEKTFMTTMEHDCSDFMEIYIYNMDKILFGDSL